MITEDLIEYVQTQTKKNVSKETIVSRLVNAGWHLEDIEEGFKKLTSPASVQVVIKPPTSSFSTTSSSTVNPLVKISVDPYRESPTAKREKEEIIPKLIPKVVQNLPKVEKVIQPTPGVVPPALPIAPAPVPKISVPVANPNTVVVAKSPTLAESALISSYPKDIASTPMIKENTSGVSKLVIWISVIVIVLILIFGIVFAYMNGLISIPFLPAI